jgi:hypothetical protein
MHFEAKKPKKMIAVLVSLKIDMDLRKSCYQWVLTIVL